MRRLPVLLLLRTSLLAGFAGLAAAQSQEPPPLLPPRAAACQPSAEEVLALANAWRQESRQCGSLRFDPAAPLRWNEALQQSALRFATELAARGELSHQGLGSPTLRQRVREVGYALRAVGENLAAGPLGLDEAFALWSSSEAHCSNLMRPDFQELGLACVAGSGRYERFWVLHLAAPARPF